MNTFKHYLEMTQKEKDECDVDYLLHTSVQDARIMIQLPGRISLKVLRTALKKVEKKNNKTLIKMLSTAARKMERNF